MLTYIIRRLLLMIPTLVGIAAVVFFVMALAPGGFGGTMLNEAGAQTEGEEARRIRQYMARRYGLDRPAPVQFLRWINQVSPIGFRTSADLTFTTDAVADARSRCAASGRLANPRDARTALDISLMLAALLDVEPQAAAARVLDALDDPGRFRVLMDDIGARAPPGPVATHDDDRAALRHLETELAGRSRVLLARPALKWPDLGLSLRGRRVASLLVEAVPVTLLLNAITIPVIYLVAIPTGIYAARFRGRLFDTLSGFVLIGLWSLPAIWVGVLLIGYLASRQYLHWFPTAGLHDLEAEAMAFLPAWGPGGFARGWLLDVIWHIVLPVVCLSYGGFAVLAKLMRGAILENIGLDYVRTARAKGVADRDVLFRHVLRNSLLPLITVAVAILPAMFVGSVVVENIFSIQGMGRLGVEAAFMKDREVVMGTTLIGGIIGLLSQLVRDIWYAIADPRVSYE